MKRLLLLLVAAPLAFLPVQVGCSNQTEGQLCNTLNGNDDCNEGLTCRTQGSANEGVCCSAASSVAACLGTGTTTGTGTTSSSSSSSSGSTTSTTSTSSSSTSSTSAQGGGGGGGGAPIPTDAGADDAG